MLQQTDEELLQQFGETATKEKAFAAVMKKYQERLYWHIRRMVIDHENANDVLQDTFVKIWNGLNNFRQESHLYTWLYRVATNESLTFLKQQKKRDSISISDLESGIANKVVAEKNFDGKKLEWQLQVAVQQLPEKQRLIFNLRYFDEMPYEAISKILKTTEGGLKANYHHAVKKIEEYIRSNSFNI